MEGNPGGVVVVAHVLFSARSGDGAVGAGLIFDHAQCPSIALHDHRIRERSAADPDV
jgi:hypothetical protein